MTKTKLTVEEFDGIIKGMETLKEDIESTISITLSASSLFNADLREVQRNINVSQNLLKRFDDTMNIYYHLLGMTTLNACQISKLTCKFRSLLELRSDLKRAPDILKKYQSLISTIGNTVSEYPITIGDIKKVLKVNRG